MRTPTARRLALVLLLGLGCRDSPPDPPPERAVPSPSRVFSGEGVVGLQLQGEWQVQGDRARVLARIREMDPQASPGIDDGEVLARLQAPPDGLFDSLAVATGGRSEDDWKSMAVLPLLNGTVEQFGDASNGWFILLLRDSAGTHTGNPIFNPYVRILASNPRRAVLYALQEVEGKPVLQSYLLTWRAEW